MSKIFFNFVGTVGIRSPGKRCSHCNGTKECDLVYYSVNVLFPCILHHIEPHILPEMII